jgi:hypothetical protein
VVGTGGVAGGAESAGYSGSAANAEPAMIAEEAARMVNKARSLIIFTVLDHGKDYIIAAAVRQRNWR